MYKFIAFQLYDNLPMIEFQSAAILLFSGGQDSTTCLFWAKKKFAKVIGLNFAYGQRHAVELIQAQKIAQIADIELITLPVPALHQIGDSALTDNEVIVPQFDSITAATNEKASGALPATFVPGRNLLFLALAGAFAFTQKINHIVTGVCQIDGSGYPDCTVEFIRSTQQTISLALDSTIYIHTPLINLTKAAIWQLAQSLDCLDIIIKETHTCYNGSRQQLHSWGYGCGQCAACLYRSAGYATAFNTQKK
jgi:7-cyano-7-deazaguanine synthase